MAEAKCYLQVAVDATRKPQAGWVINSAKVVHMTQTVPSSLAPSATHLVEVLLTIPDRLLTPIVAEAMIPELHLQAQFEATMKELEGD